MMNYKIVLAYILSIGSLFAQELLTPEKAMALTLENNFGILVAKVSESQAENNASILNSNFLPTVSATSGANIARDNQEAVFQDGNSRSIDGAETKRYNASVNLSVTLFDGLGRRYNYQRLKEAYELSSLQVKQTIEQTLLQLYASYYEVARLDESVRILSETFSNSKARLNRAQKRFSFGSATGLEVLNARVDMNADSISLIQQRQLLRNAKRNLNAVLARDLEIEFEVSPFIEFLDRSKLEGLKQEYISKNTRLQLARTDQEISELGLKAQRSALLPSLTANGAYGYTEGQFPATGFLASNNTVGLSAGVNLNWNLFRAGAQQVGIRNAKLALQASELREQQIQLEVLRDLRNADGNYSNALEVFRLQQENIQTAEENYKRAQAQFELAQITSIELRQAQINLLSAELLGVQAKFAAKLAELEYLNHCGYLLDVAF